MVATWNACAACYYLNRCVSLTMTITTMMTTSEWVEQEIHGKNKSRLSSLDATHTMKFLMSFWFSLIEFYWVGTEMNIVWCVWFRCLLNHSQSEQFYNFRQFRASLVRGPCQHTKQMSSQKHISHLNSSHWHTHTHPHPTLAPHKIVKLHKIYTPCVSIQYTFWWCREKTSKICHRKYLYTFTHSFTRCAHEKRKLKTAMAKWELDVCVCARWIEKSFGIGTEKGAHQFWNRARSTRKHKNRTHTHTK